VRRGPKPFTYTTYANPVYAWNWFNAAVGARKIAQLKASRGEAPAVSIVTELATGRTWTIAPDTDLLTLEASK